MNTILKDVKNIIFDLGEVITDVDFDKTIDAFSKIAGKDTHEIYNYNTQSDIFNLLETGKISPAKFTQDLRNLLKTDKTNKELIDAWNAMLGDTPLEKLKFINQLRPTYKTFILSNTNAIHIEWINNYLYKKYQLDNLNDFFDKVYLSHEIKERKPNLESYLLILNENNLKANETLFIDDKLENIKAANTLGMKTLHLKDKNKLIELLS